MGGAPVPADPGRLGASHPSALKNDRIDLDGYGKNAVKDAFATQNHVANGLQITLTDSTTITFMGLSSLTRSSFDGD